ncbi:MAG: phosphoenolpyruvate--protein phosphotransferase [Thermincolia bacterium]
MAEQRIYGIGASEGIRMGKAFLYHQISEQDYPEYVSDEEVEGELTRLRQAKEETFKELNELIEMARQSLGEEKAVILKGQQSFLADPTFYHQMEQSIIKEHFTAQKAVNQVVQKFVSIFEGMPNEYMRERSIDIKDLGRRLLNNLLGKKGLRLAEIKEPVILVAEDLTPSDTVQLDKNIILGFITRIGGKTSHTAIISRSLGIAAVLGVGAGIDMISADDFVIIDGSKGICIISPDANTLEEYHLKLAAEAKEQQVLQKYIAQHAISKDGVRVEIAANIGTVQEAQVALEHGTDGIGLYRTEFLFMTTNELPDEEVQYQAYKEVLTTMGNRSVVIRTLDIGGDKVLPYLSLPKELNPFLGYRAIRLCLDQKELLITQLRAILRASVYGQVKIMFPMISSLEEWRAAKEVYEAVQVQLSQEGIPFDPSVELGIMIEIPSAALLATTFAKEVDFFSIGTNDLVQYTLAVDRMNEKVAYLYDHFHPAVINLLKTVIDAAHKEGKWVGMCGGMAGDPLATPLLLGLGLDEFSMSATAMQKVKRIITQVEQEQCRQLLAGIMELDTALGIRHTLEQFSANLIDE